MAGDCKACRSSYYCDFIYDDATETCPCKECLIKTQCMEQCDDFIKAYTKKFNFPPGDGKGW